MSNVVRKGLASAVKGATLGYSPLALWHLLSLDAPSVAALWTVFLARICHVALPWTAPAALALAVWMLYAADRLADAAAGKALEERHRFHQRHRAAFAVCWFAAAPVLLWLVLRLPHALRDGWLLMALPLVAYVGAVHALQWREVPKEPLIAMFFSTAAAMPVWSAGHEIVIPVTLFAMLCWLNCAAIAAWETSAQSHIDPLTRWLGRHLLLAVCLGVVLSLSLGLSGASSFWPGVSALLSLGTLALLQRRRDQISHLRLRAMADVALLSPAVILPLLAWRGL